MKEVKLIPIAKIRIINSRARNKTKFQEIVGNISKLGLKKPITVSRRGENDDGFDLVCGQGRLEAYSALGQTEVPAVIIDVPLEERYIMSLVENLARRSHTTLEMAREIVALKERGYNNAQIAEKIDFSETHVAHLVRLLQKGEERLVQAVERGEIPIGVAIEIAALDDESVQRSLAQAYESGKLRGRALLKARRLVEVRRARGKGVRGVRGAKTEKAPTVDDLVRRVRRESHRQDLLVKKARLCERQLRFITSALKELFEDENFVNLVRAEKIDELPKQIAETIRKK